MPEGEEPPELECSDVEWAATEIRNEYRRILDKEDLKLLKKVAENNRLEYNERLRPLLQLLALLGIPGRRELVRCPSGFEEIAK